MNASTNTSTPSLAAVLDCLTLVKGTKANVAVSDWLYSIKGHIILNKRTFLKYVETMQNMRCLIVIQIFKYLLYVTIMKAYNFDPLKPHFYIVKLMFTLFFLFFFKNIDFGYSLELPPWGSSNEYPQSMFWAEIWKISMFFIWKFSVFGGEIFYIFE